MVDPKAKGKPAPKAAPKKAAAKPAGGKGKGAAATAVVVPADPLLALQPVVLPLGLHDTAVQGLSQVRHTSVFSSWQRTLVCCVLYLVSVVL